MPAHEPPDDRSPQLRVSDEDRERTVLALRDGAAEGRLTFDELAQRRPGTPMVRVRGYALMGGLEARVKRSGTSTAAKRLTGGA